jgi:hypothetical protein
VWIVEVSKLVQRNVTLGSKGAERIEVVDGIGANDLIITKPTTALVAGQAVKAELPAKTQP